MIFRVIIKRKARTSLLGLPAKEIARIDAAMSALAQNPKPPGCKKLTASPYHRIRCGDYRVIYEIYEETATVDIIAIGHRKNVYRRP